MLRSWSLACSVMLTSLCCAVHPERQEQSIKKHHDPHHFSQIQVLSNEEFAERSEFVPQGRLKRETADCSELETGERTGLQEILDTSDEEQSFFIQPQPGFNRLKIRMKLNLKFDLRSWRYAKETLDINISQLDIDWTQPTWIPVKVKYFKNEKSFGRDRHALRVKVGDNVSEELITRWWRTHSYEGFTVYAEGPLKVIFKCNQQNVMGESASYKEERQILLVVIVLGVCCLTVVGVSIAYLTIKCSRDKRNKASPMPSFPKSLLLERHSNQKTDSEHIYETIDEVKLAKLRQNLDPATLGRTRDVMANSGSSAMGFRDKIKIWDLPLRKECHSSPGIKDGVAEGATDISLLEQKATLRQYSGLDSPVESHYVEMHGIVSRTSSLNK